MAAKKDTTAEATEVEAVEAEAEATDDTPSDIIWEEPPTPKTRGKYDPFYEALSANPGKTARFPGSTATATNKQREDARFQVTTRTVTNDKGESERVAWMTFDPDKAKDNK